MLINNFFHHTYGLAYRAHQLIGHNKCTCYDYEMRMH